MKRCTNDFEKTLPKIAIDLGYSAKQKSCGVATSHDAATHSLAFGECIDFVDTMIRERGRHTLIIEAVLSTYHSPDGNPAIRGTFEKGRGWYHNPGVTTFATARKSSHRRPAANRSVRSSKACRRSGGISSHKNRP